MNTCSECKYWRDVKPWGKSGRYATGTCGKASMIVECGPSEACAKSADGKEIGILETVNHFSCNMFECKTDSPR